MDSIQWKALKMKLEQEETRLVQQIDKIKNNGLQMSLSESTGELSLNGVHSADVATETFERSKDIGLIDNTESLLFQIRQALERAENGTYGFCEECKKPIEEERLESFPWVGKCIECQEKEDSMVVIGRPIEEESLHPENI